MLTNIEKNQIKQTISQPQWATIERLAKLVIDQINEQDTLADSEWKTMQNLLMKEGKVRGIKQFIQECYAQAGNTS